MPDIPRSYVEYGYRIFGVSLETLAPLLAWEERDENDELVNCGPEQTIQCLVGDPSHGVDLEVRSALRIENNSDEPRCIYIAAGELQYEPANARAIAAWVHLVAPQALLRWQLLDVLRRQTPVLTIKVHSARLLTACA